ncbi:Bidirectional sugar transporter SWEET10-like [Parasponia andersonii]|uniref:Bidirectional sugar transporter SWEET n=1 Tax=Parasponia andersonii TaxID=3476 RepID=A0A2P5C806_PARAD|nr:Bidirectional sugar transporter SWEET10-like [Parasponia andersonii]
MAAMNASHLVTVFGILGNVVSFLVFLAPLPTFYRIYKKKSTEGFQSIPYSVALFSATLTLYYGFLKTSGGFMIVTINSIGCVIETIYLIFYLIYASGRIRIFTIKLLIIFNLVAYGLILVSTNFMIPKRSQRVNVVGWICAVFSVCVFAAPLSIMRLVIKTKSVEYMPFALSFCLTLSAVMWFFYGLLINDFFIASPNILGFIFGIAQMILYLVYKNTKKEVLPEFQLQEILPNDVVEIRVAEGGTANGNNNDVSAVV